MPLIPKEMIFGGGKFQRLLAFRDICTDRYVVCSECGTLGFYCKNSSRHIKKTVIAFRYKRQAERIAAMVRSSACVEAWVESRKSGELEDFTSVENKTESEV